MPILQVELLKGRTVEQKREMVRKVTDAITETLNCPSKYYYQGNGIGKFC